MAEYLVLQAARFGDLLQTKRLLLSVQRLGTVHLLLDSALAPLAKRLYPFAHVHAFTFHGHLDRKNLASNAQTVATLQHLNINAVINCNCSGLTEAVARSFSCPVLGNRPHFCTDGGVRRDLVTRLLQRTTMRRTLSTLNLEDAWAHMVQDPIAPNLVNPKPVGGGKGLGVVLMGREARRSLSAEIVAELIRIYVQVLPKKPHIYLLGTAQENPMALKIRRLLPANIWDLVQNLTGKTSLLDLFEVLTDLDLLLTPDTGTMHLAAHLGVPVQAYFLSSALCHETGPYGEGHKIVQAIFDCSPCLERNPCSFKVRCLEPFRCREFFRFSTLTAQGKPCEIPEGLQFFEQTMDALGVLSKCLAGVDPYAEKRRCVRQLFATDLGVRLEEDLVFDSRILQAMLQDRDWMLPKSRYA